MGGDSIASSGSNRTIIAMPKVFRVNHEFLIGYTTSFRMGQLLQYGFIPPARKPECSIEEYMIMEFVEALRGRFKDAGFAKVTDNVEWGGTFLVGYSGRLFKIDSDYQVNENAKGIDTCGYGGEVALAVLLALPKIAPPVRIKRALEIAAELSVYVAPPFVIEKL